MFIHASIICCTVFLFFPRKILNEDWVITFAQLMVYVSLGDIYSIRAISLY